MILCKTRHQYNTDCTGAVGVAGVLKAGGEFGMKVNSRGLINLNRGTA